MTRSEWYTLIRSRYARPASWAFRMAKLFVQYDCPAVYSVWHIAAFQEDPTPFLRRLHALPQPRGPYAIKH